uniref:NOL1/NOP2/Sun domain family member 4 n=1 Tax=Timema cristinae TaxID=61476 RepID=A0A7R9CXX9_TIMCR|nr:unnamed protein product [Timema cristinae]
MNELLLSVKLKKKFPKDKALQHFDDFYKTVYGDKWPSIRIALLSPHKYCALINNFGDTEQIMTHLEKQGALNIKTLFELEERNIKEQKIAETRKEDLEKIYKLDQKMEQLMLSKQHEEVESVYPQHEGVSKDGPNKLEPSLVSRANEDLPPALSSESHHAASLQSSLESAEYDTHRLIDPSVGLSASALYEFVPATKLKGMEDFVLESEHYAYYKKDTDFPVHVEKEKKLNFPDHLHILTFERGNVSYFPSPRRSSTGVFNYFLLDGGSLLPVLALDLQPGDKVLDMCAAPGGKSLMMLQTLYPDYFLLDGGSLLPVLALDLQPGDKVLDMCAAPGGKSLMMLQTLYPDILVCNDVLESRVKRIHSVMQQFLYDLDKWGDRLKVTQKDGRDIDECNVYNKVSALSSLATLAINALKLVSPGGTVVYSTCSLSPIQNDGVVHMALRQVWQETNIEVAIIDLSPALQSVQSVFSSVWRDGAALNTARTF